MNGITAQEWLERKKGQYREDLVSHVIKMTNPGASLNDDQAQELNDSLRDGEWSIIVQCASPTALARSIATWLNTCSQKQ